MAQLLFASVVCTLPWWKTSNSPSYVMLEGKLSTKSFHIVVKGAGKRLRTFTSCDSNDMSEHERGHNQRKLFHLFRRLSRWGIFHPCHPPECDEFSSAVDRSSTLKAQKSILSSIIHSSSLVTIACGNFLQIAIKVVSVSDPQFGQLSISINFFLRGRTDSDFDEWIGPQVRKCPV